MSHRDSKRAIAAPSRLSGFTVLEMTISLVLLGAIAAVAFTRMPNEFFTGRGPVLQKTQDQIVSDLKRARDLAFGCGEPDTQMVVRILDDGYILDDGADPCTDQAVERSIQEDLTLSVVSGASPFAFRYPEARVSAPGDPATADDVGIRIDVDGQDRFVCIRAGSGAIERGSC